MGGIKNFFFFSIWSLTFWAYLLGDSFISNAGGVKSMLTWQNNYLLELINFEWTATTFVIGWLDLRSWEHNTPCEAKRREVFPIVKIIILLAIWIIRCMNYSICRSSNSISRVSSVCPVEIAAKDKTHTQLDTIDDFTRQCRVIRTLKLKIYVLVVSEELTCK